MSTEESMTRVVTEYISNTKFDDIPINVIDQIKRCVLNGIGCGLFGSTTPGAKTAVDYVRRNGGTEEATIWCHNFKVPAINAPLANTLMVNIFEMDDTYMRGGLHPACLILPSALAVSEREGSISGEEFLTAVTVAYEIMVRVGSSLCPPHGGGLRGFYNQSVSGTIGSAVAAGKILGLDADTLLSTLAIAGATSAGIFSRTIVKRWALCKASQSGIMAADLSKAGWVGIPNILEDERYGFIQAFSDERFPELVTTGLGEAWESSLVGIKPHSCFTGSHATIDGIQILMRKHPEIKPDTIEKITLEGTRNLRHQRARAQVDNIMNAMMSIRYVGAVTVFDGQCLPDQFTDEKIKDPKIQELLDRIDVIENPDFEKRPELSRWHTVVHIKLKDGRTFQEEVPHPKGTPENPMTMEETYAKFRYMASKGVGKDKAEDILNTVGKLERLKDISALTELLE